MHETPRRERLGQVTPPPDAGQIALLTCNHAGSSRARDAVTGLTPGVTRRTRLARPARTRLGARRPHDPRPARPASGHPVNAPAADRGDAVAYPRPAGTH